MDEELRQRLDRIEQKVEAAHVAAERARKYLLILVIITVVTLVLPLIVFLFAIPSVLSSYGDLLSI